VPKHVVVIYVINIISVHQIVVLDSRYTPVLVLQRHNGDDEPYDIVSMFQSVVVPSFS
jgi:hypothetical protein